MKRIPCPKNRSRNTIPAARLSLLGDLSVMTVPQLACVDLTLGRSQYQEAHVSCKPSNSPCPPSSPKLRESMERPSPVSASSVVTLNHPLEARIPSELWYL